MTACARTAGTANTVHVVFTVIRQIVVEDVRNGWNVQTARGHVGRYQDVQVATGEFFQNTQAFFLRHVACQQAYTMSVGG